MQVDFMAEKDNVKSRVRLEDYAAAHLARARRGGEFVCPSCNSGGNPNPNSDSAFQIYKEEQRFMCHVCNIRGDVFDLAGCIGNTDDKTEQLRLVADWAGIPIDGNSRKTQQNSPQCPINKKEVSKPTYDETRALEAAYVAKTRNDISNPEALSFLKARGMTLEGAKAAGMGYDASRKRLIIPWQGTDYYHIDRDVTDAHPHKYEKPKSSDVGAQPFYNPEVLKQQAFYVCEGAFDALAIQAAGMPATCLGGLATRSFLNELSSKGYAGTVILALDNDKRGQGAAAKLAAELEGAGLHSVASSLFNGMREDFKDPAEALQAKGLQPFAEMLKEDCEKAQMAAKSAKREAYEKTLQALRVVDAKEVITAIYDGTDFTEPIPTGISALDDALDGGLYAKRLYMLGAISSLGKTTLAVQIADNLAEAGNHVLFVTIEQSASEIAAKSLSRMMKQANPKGYAPSASEITSKKRREAWDMSRYADLLAACSRYADGVAPRLHILEGTKQPKVDDIATVAKIIKAEEGKAPVIFIDYLQLLAPQNERDSDKQIIDKNIMSLRHLARDLAAPVFVISSLNRASYNGAVEMESFKESGSIEYGSDVLLGLQPEGMEYETGSSSKCKTENAGKKATKENKSKIVRDCEIVFLKNRSGALHSPVSLTFYAVNSMYEQKKPLRL